MRDDPGSGSAAQPVLEEHPRGTLAIVLIFGALFVIGWFAFYLVGFMQRGAPHH